ncbi:MAG: TetR/AcrR family transcriptional regulator [Acidimicrobiales bacterium]
MDGTSIVRRPPFGSNPLVGERGSDTQRKILTAALDVFAEVGFNEARVELITTRAGCSRPAFYQYFSSKDDVFWQLAEQLGREMVQLGHRLDHVTEDARGIAALEAWIDEFMGLYEDYAPVFSAFQAASRDHEPMVQGSSGISGRLGADLLGAFGIEGRSRRNATLAASVVAVLIRCSFYWRSLEATVDHDRLVTGLAQLVHRLLAGPIEGVNVHRRDIVDRDVPEVPVPDGNADATLRPRGQKTRQLLLDAGTEVLPARGYHDARVDDIVEAAGVSHGSFYRYFENKEDFFRVLAEEASTRMVELLDAFPLDAPEAALRSWLEEWFATYSSNGGVISTWQEMQTVGDDLVSFGQEVAATILARLMAMLDRRGFGDPLVDALALLAVVERLPYSVFTLRFTKRADAIDAMVTIIRRGFLGHDVEAVA